MIATCTFRSLTRQFKLSNCLALIVYFAALQSIYTNA